MGAPSPKLCNPLAGSSVENRLELPAVGVIACSLVVRVTGRARFASHAPSSCTVVAVTLLSLLAAAAGAATADELFIYQPVVQASDPASLQLEQGKSADHANPPELASLRRAWTADPAIRDFKGLQESDWNFDDPNSIPGFGELGPEVDVRRMLAQILGEAPRLTFAAEAAGRTK
jgi:hypothetical protein